MKVIVILWTFLSIDMPAKAGWQPSDQQFDCLKAAARFDEIIATFPTFKGIYERLVLREQIRGLKVGSVS